MNLFRKFCALFGAEYAVIFVKNIWVWEGRTKVSVQRVKKLAAGVWVIARCKTLLNPGGGVGDRCIEWKPLTKGVEKFYNSEVVKEK